MDHGQHEKVEYTKNNTWKTIQGDRYVELV